MKQKQQQNIQVIQANKTMIFKQFLFFVPNFFVTKGEIRRAKNQIIRVLTETIKASSTQAQITPASAISKINLKQYQNSVLLKFINYLMNQNSGLTYHNVDSYIENEGFFCYEQYTRLDLKQVNWEHDLQNLTEDLIALISEYVDLENLEIFLAILEFLEHKIKDSTEDSPYFSLRDGMSQTSLNNYILSMLENIEQGLRADNKDYKAIDYPGLLKLEDVLNFMKGCEYFSSHQKQIDQLFKIWKEQIQYANKIKK